MISTEKQWKFDTYKLCIFITNLRASHLFSHWSQLWQSDFLWPYEENGRFIQAKLDHLNLIFNFWAHLFKVIYSLLKEDFSQDEGLKERNL